MHLEHKFSLLLFKQLVIWFYASAQIFQRTIGDIKNAQWKTKSINNQREWKHVKSPLNEINEFPTENKWSKRRIWNAMWKRFAKNHKAKIRVNDHMLNKHGKKLTERVWIYSSQCERKVSTAITTNEYVGRRHSQNGKSNSW